MADAVETQASKNEKSSMPTVAIALAGMAGVTVATLLVAPKVVASRAAVVVEAAGNETNDDVYESTNHGVARSGGHGRGAPSGDFVELGNILVNPAGSQGLRFLMVSVTFEVLGKDGDAVDLLRTRDAQLRDMVIGVLEEFDLNALATVGIRDSVKHRLAAAVDSVFHVPVGVFMPQFVIN